MDCKTQWGNDTACIVTRHVESDPMAIANCTNNESHMPKYSTTNSEGILQVAKGF